MLRTNSREIRRETSCIVDHSLKRRKSHVHKMTVRRVGLKDARVAGDVAVPLQHPDGPQAATTEKMLK